MPGTIQVSGAPTLSLSLSIQVSVLDLVGLPSSSSSSPVSVKVAMGKREYQTWDKGEFLFPLMTLRDNLVITLHDAEGNEISRTDVKTMSVVEKGVWDDLFPLKGGGQVHMKLQFILSEEEHKRIQYMRESVVKKKEELIKKSPMHSEISTDPVVILPESVVQTKDANVSKEPIKDFILNQMVHHEDSQPRHALQDGQSNETTTMEGGLYQPLLFSRFKTILSALFIICFKKNTTVPKKHSRLNHLLLL